MESPIFRVSPKCEYIIEYKIYIHIFNMVLKICYKLPCRIVKIIFNQFKDSSTGIDLNRKKVADNKCF